MCYFYHLMIASSDGSPDQEFFLKLNFDSDLSTCNSWLIWNCALEFMNCYLNSSAANILQFWSMDFEIGQVRLALQFMAEDIWSNLCSTRDRLSPAAAMRCRSPTYLVLLSSFFYCCLISAPSWTNWFGRQYSISCQLPMSVNSNTTRHIHSVHSEGR